MYDAAIIGGGPAGLSAALNLARARRRVLLLDAGEPRNAKAIEVHGFMTRDGTPPQEMRRLVHEELARYGTVERKIEWVKSITAHADRVSLTIGCDSIDAKAVLIAAGMVDEVPELPGYRALWGESIFQCPYCHGYEHRDRAWGYLARTEQMIGFPLLLKAWTEDVVLFSNGLPITDEQRAQLARAEVRIEERAVQEFVARDGKLAAVRVDGGEVARQVLFAHPPQRQTALVTQLGVELDETGFVKIDMMNQTSVPRVYAAGDAVSGKQSAIIAAGSGAFAGAAINHALAMH